MTSSRRHVGGATWPCAEAAADDDEDEAAAAAAAEDEDGVESRGRWETLSRTHPG